MYDERTEQAHKIMRKKKTLTRWLAWLVQKHVVLVCVAVIVWNEHAMRYECDSDNDNVAPAAANMKAGRR